MHLFIKTVNLSSKKMRVNFEPEVSPQQKAVTPAIGITAFVLHLLSWLQSKPTPWLNQCQQRQIFWMNMADHVNTTIIRQITQRTLQFTLILTVVIVINQDSPTTPTVLNAEKSSYLYLTHVCVERKT